MPIDLACYSGVDCFSKGILYIGSTTYASCQNPFAMTHSPTRSELFLGDSSFQGTKYYELSCLRAWEPAS